MLLALETATQICSMALFDGQDLLAEYRLKIKNAHQRCIADAVRMLLDHCGISAQELSAIAVSTGPGSFTGLRIGLSLAKGLAMPFGIRVIPVPTLQALAAAAPPGTNPLGVLLRSKAEQVYAGLYDGVDLRELQPVAIVDRDKLVNYFPPDCRITGQCELLPASHPFREVPMPYCLADAKAVAQLARQKTAQGSIPDSDTLEPNYLADFIAGRPKSYF